MGPIVLWSLRSGCNVFELFDVDSFAVACNVMVLRFVVTFQGDAVCDSECIHYF
jgi:hypothetical protein